MGKGMEREGKEFREDRMRGFERIVTELSLTKMRSAKRRWAHCGRGGAASGGGCQRQKTASTVGYGRT